MVGVAFLFHFMGTGFIFYCYGVFFRPLQDLFGWSRFTVGAGLYVISIMSAFYSPAVARLMERRGIRWTMATGACVLSLGFLALHFIENLWQYYVVLGGLVAFGGVCVGPLPSNTLVANWFERHRGKALGIATVGLSLSGLVLVPSITLLVERIGLLNTYAVLAVALIVILLPPALAVVITRPEDIGLRPDGEVRLPEEKADVPLMVPAATESAYISRTDYLRSTTAVLRDRVFWLLIASFSLVYMSLGAILIHMIPHFSDVGLPPTGAAFALSITAGAGVLGKLVFGYMADNFSKKSAVLFSFVTQIAGTVLLLFAQTHMIVYVFAGLFGFGMGGVVPLHASVIAEIFGRRAFASVSGLTHFFMVPIQAVGAPLAGWLFDRQGTYDLAWKIFLVNYIAATLLFLWIPIRRRR
jgi:MFS family permease